MTDARSYDAVVIGAGVNGLAAATYLAAAGKRVVVVEGRSRLGGRSGTDLLGNGFRFSRAAHTLYALDPRIVSELKLAQHGLDFAVRNTPLVGLRGDGKHVLLTGDAKRTARNIALHSDADAETWPRFQRETYGLARELRALWWQTGPDSPAGIASDSRVQRLARTGLAAWLDHWFDCDALKATLGFDAYAMSPLAAGSALLFVWRAAQEMCGLQGAVAVPRGGLRNLTNAFAGAAFGAGVELRTGARVVDIVVGPDRKAQGVALASGEMIAAPWVFSSLSRAHSLRFAAPRAALDFAASAALARATQGVAMARVTLALDRQPVLLGSTVPQTSRFIVAERLESLAAAHAAAYSGRLPQELTLEAFMPTAADADLAPAGHHVMSVLVGPLPVEPASGWKDLRPLLAAKTVVALGKHFAHLSRHIVALDVLSPQDAEHVYGEADASGGTVDAVRLLADWRARVQTPIAGLVLCGASADPVGAVSGRGGRVAAAYAIACGSPS